MSSGELTFDLTLIEIAVTLSGEQYTLREADGEAGAQFENAKFQGAKIDEVTNTVVSLPNLGDQASLLVSLCLFDKDNNLVPLETVRSWPDRVVTPLYKKAREISGLDEDDEEVAVIERKLERAKLKAKTVKNEPSATTDGSK